jgi:chemotaxis methyl-accepting protein methylase
MTPDQYRAFIKEVLPPLGYQWRRFDRRNTRRKIRRRMEHLGIHEPSAYVALLSEDPKEKTVFESLLPVTITRFFRNAQVWFDFRDIISKACGGPGGRVQDLSLWCAGCTGGEEAYTAAMLLDDAVGSGTVSCSWSVLGTDIDVPSLERSRDAKYSWGAVREIPSLIRLRWFLEENSAWVLDYKVHALVDIRCHNIVSEDPPGAFHAVFLRNSILTYNTEKIQREVLEKIRGCLLEPGLLVIGRTEKLPAGEGFEEIRKCIYRKV